MFTLQIAVCATEMRIMRLLCFVFAFDWIRLFMTQGELYQWDSITFTAKRKECTASHTHHARTEERKANGVKLANAEFHTMCVHTGRHAETNDKRLKSEESITVFHCWLTLILIDWDVCALCVWETQSVVTIELLPWKDVLEVRRYDNSIF